MVSLPAIRGRDPVDFLKQNPDRREELIRKLVYEHLDALPAAGTGTDLVATYCVLGGSRDLESSGKEFSYHQTTAVRKVKPGTLLAECTGRVIDSSPFDGGGSAGLVRVAFPLKMFLGEEGRLYSTDILHVTAGAGEFALLEFPDVKLVRVEMPGEMVASFPGPRFGPEGVRELTGFEEGRVAFGTIIKPCTGITPREVADKVESAAGNRLFMFVKEDEELLPNVSFCPLAERVRLGVEAAKRAEGKRGVGSIIYAPHVTSNPSCLLENVRTAVAGGATGLMFSEYYTGGALRLVRDTLERDGMPVPIYGHNGGISTRTRHIYREVLDWLARLDGMDFRQTAPLSEKGLLRPSGLEWRQCEQVLRKPAGGIKPVTVTRAGGLDQGNIILNLEDVSGDGKVEDYLFLAGSAINSFKNAQGEEDAHGGAAAMEQAVEAFGDPSFDNSAEEHVSRLKSYAGRRGFRELSLALDQRYR